MPRRLSVAKFPLGKDIVALATAFADPGIPKLNRKPNAVIDGPSSLAEYA